MSDSFRSVEIKGTDEEQCAALAAIIDAAISDKQSLYGGARFRFTTYLVMAFILFAILFFPIARVKISPLPWLPPATAIGLSLLYAVLINASWAPGFVIYSTNESFMETYAPLFTFLGFVLAVAALPPTISKLFKRNPGNQTPALENKNPGTLKP